MQYISRLFYVKYFLFLLNILYLIRRTEARVYEEDACLKFPIEYGYRYHCYQLQKWDKMARDHKKKKITLPPGISSINQANAAADFASIPSQIYQCMDLDCVCSYIEDSIVAPDGSCTLKDGSKVEKAVRKEIRQLSEDERQRLFKALQTLKDSGEYDHFARLHKHGDKAASAHSGPGFLGWHREFNKRMEFAIRQIDPSLSLPYYDMTLDGVLPGGEANNSVIFSKYLLGESFGVYPTNSIINGPFAGWKSTETGSIVNRTVGTLPGSARPMTQEIVDNITKLTDYVDVLGYPAAKSGCPYEAGPHYTEAAHGSGHNFVGGDMSELITAAIDPIFFFFHSFVDKIWEDWRQLRQTRAEREIQYPKDNDRCAAVQHFVGANMYPFSPLKNIDGLSNKYTDNLYSYAPKPTCSRANPDGCNSEFLFCDFRNNTARCAAKVKAGTRCHYWTEENPCYLGECRNGRCVETMTKGSTKVTAAKKTNTNRKLNSQVGCYNENKCCAHWASKGECSKNVDYMNQYCKASCGQCFASTYLLTDDCSDRHNQCSAWARSGECEKANKEWMSENCRKSCQMCSLTRLQECGPEAATIAKKKEPEEAKCENSGTCNNENVCCSYWALRGECHRSARWMGCNCPVSCALCEPTYSYGSCIDYDRRCRGWAQSGECLKNPWMSENCRYSCTSCYSQWDLDKKCRGRAGSVAPVSPGPSAIQRLRLKGRRRTMGKRDVEGLIENYDKT